MSAEHEQLLDPVVWFSDVAESGATGLAYNSNSGVLYQVGNRWEHDMRCFDLGAFVAVIGRSFYINRKKVGSVQNIIPTWRQPWRELINSNA